MSNQQNPPPKEWTGELPQEVLELNNPYANSAYTHYRAVEKLSHAEALAGALQAHRSHPLREATMTTTVCAECGQHPALVRLVPIVAESPEAAYAKRHDASLTAVCGDCSRRLVREPEVRSRHHFYMIADD